jgi:hypothetical protein
MSTAITEWNQRKIVTAVKAEVAANMEIAAAVVEVDARRRLLRIVEPEFGRAYRRVLALYRLISRVVIGENAVEGQIGIPPGKESGDYGFWIEVGSHTYAAQPWLRPALMDNLKDIIKLLAGR